MSLAAALGGAAQGFQALWLKNYEQKLKQQEEANAEARALRLMGAKAEIETKSRAGTAQGAPSLTPEGTYVGWALGEDGKTLERKEFGKATEAEMAAYRAEQEREQRKEELGLADLMAGINSKEAQAIAARARAGASSARADLDRGRLAEPERFRRGGAESKPPTPQQLRAAEQLAAERAMRESGGSRPTDPKSPANPEAFQAAFRRNLAEILGQTGLAPAGEPTITNPNDPLGLLGD